MFTTLRRAGNKFTKLGVAFILLLTYFVAGFSPFIGQAVASTTGLTERQIGLYEITQQFLQTCKPTAAGSIAVDYVGKENHYGLTYATGLINVTDKVDAAYGDGQSSDNDGSRLGCDTAARNAIRIIIGEDGSNA